MNVIMNTHKEDHKCRQSNVNTLVWGIYMRQYVGYMSDDVMKLCLWALVMKQDIVRIHEQKVGNIGKDVIILNILELGGKVIMRNVWGWDG